MSEAYDFSVELNVTRAYRENMDATLAKKELSCLKAMYPAVLCPIQPQDQFAGRISMSLVGVSPEPGGLGYYCNRDAIKNKLRQYAYSDETKTRIIEMLK